MYGGWKRFAPIPLRLALGFGFMYHGYPKVFTATGHDSFVGMLQGLGVPAADLMAWSVGLFEFVGGLLLIVGAFTALVSVLGAAEMLFAALAVHLPHGFNFLNITGQTQTGGPTFGMPGYEVNVLYIGGFLTLLMAGAGAWSVDEARRRPEKELTGRLPVEPLEADVPDRAWSGAPQSEKPVGSGVSR